MQSPNQLPRHSRGECSLQHVGGMEGWKQRRAVFFNQIYHWQGCLLCADTSNLSPPYCEFGEISQTAQHYQHQPWLSFVDEEHLGGQGEKGDLSHCIPVILSCCKALEGAAEGEGCSSSQQLNTNHRRTRLFAPMIILKEAQGSLNKTLKALSVLCIPFCV